MGCHMSNGYQQQPVEGERQLKTCLTQRQISLVRTSWETVSVDMQAAGLVIFNRLFQIEKGLKPLFLRLSKQTASTCDLEDVPIDHGMLQTHAMIVMQALGAAVESLDDSQLLTDTLVALGRIHVGYDVKPYMFAKLWPAIQYGLQCVLQEDYTTEVDAAWRMVFEFMVEKMQEGMEVA